MNRFLKRWAVLIVGAVVLLGSCTWINSILGRVDVLYSLDIQDASALFVAVSDSPLANRAVASGTAVMYKLPNGGEVLEVTVTGESGDEITEVLTPTGVYDLNPTYIIVTYLDIPGREVPAVLVRKTDGAVFSLDEVGIPVLFNEGGPFMDLPSPKSDASSTIYFMAQVEESRIGVVALDIGDPTALTVSNVSPVTDNVIGFKVTTDGDVAYVYGDGGSNRIRKSNGGIHNLPDAIWFAMWVGTDGNLHYQDKSGIDPNEIYTVTMDAAGNVTTDFVVGTGLTNSWFSSISGYILRLADRIYLAETLNGYIAEVGNPTNSPRGIVLAEIDTIDFAGSSDNHYFLSGTDDTNNPVLLKVDPLTDIVTTLLPSGGVLYDLIALAVAPDETITFNALRLSDGVKVVGQVAPDGTVTFLDETLNLDVISLEQLI